MKWFFIFLLIIFSVLIFISFTKIKVNISYRHVKDNDNIKIQFLGLFGLIRYNTTVPAVKIDKDSPTIIVRKKTETGQNETNQKEETEQFSPDDFIHMLHDAQQLAKHIVEFSKIIRRLLKKITVTKLEWNSSIGVKDAAYTGMLTGVLWTVKGSLIGAICKYLTVRTMPHINITPHFQETISQTSFTCMIHFRVGNAILAGIALLRHWKGNLPQFKSKSLSPLSNLNTKSS